MTFSNETLDQYFVSMNGELKLCVYDTWHTIPLTSEILPLKEALDNKWKFIVTLGSEYNIVSLRVNKVAPNEFIEQINEIRKKATDG